MIWECTVCTNHFDGTKPPAICSCCGSPTEYFTAYHYYGLKTPSEQPFIINNRIQRPSYTESSIDSVTCYRFHSKKRFKSLPGEFFHNFLESRHKFISPCRFAGQGFNCGFYFATTIESAIEETLFYNDIKPDRNLSSPQMVLQKLKSLKKDFIFLEATISLNKIADLTNPVILEYFLREGPTRANIRPSLVPFSLLRAIVSSNQGGSKTTDDIGYFASSNGWNGIKFPSVRALRVAWGIKELTRHDLLSKLAKDHPRAKEESVVDQLRNQANLVVFSGSLLTRSISRFVSLDSDGNRMRGQNPFYGMEKETLESVRIAFREQSQITLEKAAEGGYLSDEEIREEYTPRDLFWIPTKK